MKPQSYFACFCFLFALPLLSCVNNLEAADVNMIFCCQADNDLYQVLSRDGHTWPRYDSATDAVDHAPRGAALFILADGYPDARTVVEPDLFARAKEKKLKMYVEFPESLPGFEIGTTRTIQWERGVITSDLFGSDLKPMSILAIHDCHFVPVEARNPPIVIARVAGFDNAVYGLPDE
ncbi:MAG: hypothetical protein ABIH23_11980, partial [bacterium]